MRRNPFYTAYGALLLLMLGTVQYTGFSLGSLDQARQLPKTIRENPGVYRPNYGSAPRTFGGK
jgi:hypothetical protein